MDRAKVTDRSVVSAEAGTFLANGQIYPGRMQAMYGFVSGITAEGNWDALVQQSIRKLLLAFPSADAGAIFLHRSGPDRLRAAAATGYDTESWQKLSLRVGESIVGRAFQSGDTFVCADSQTIAVARASPTPANDLLLRSLVRGCESPRGVVCTPLTCGDTRLGAVLLETWRKPTSLSESDRVYAVTLVGLLALAMDRFRLRREVRYSRQMLEEASKLQQDILSSLSHDMRTPLASIKGYASALLLDEVQWETSTVREYLEIITEESDHLGEIIVDLLETSMIDAGHLKIEVEPLRLDRLAHEVADGISRRADGHRFVLSFAAGFPIVDADGGRIRRVLFNLLDNAVKYSPAGGLIVVRGEYNDSEVLISVADQGQGIAPEHLNRLFERFFRAKFVSGKHIVGSGLGLPIARTIVELHGGRIWAESTPGQGTTMHFALPRGGLSQAAVGGEE